VSYGCASAAIAAHWLTPVVDPIFEMNDAVEASAHVAVGGRHFGKIALNVK
jgi:NADPH:quinone reductase-like Zn-dependent oxidoreductase